MLIYFLPFDLLPYTQLFKKILRLGEDLWQIIRLNENTTVKIRVVLTLFITFVKPNIYHKTKY